MAPPARSAAQAGDEKGGQDSAQTLRQETEQAHKLLRDAKTLRRASLISIDSENEHKLVEVTLSGERYTLCILTFRCNNASSLRSCLVGTFL